MNALQEPKLTGDDKERLGGKPHILVVEDDDMVRQLSAEVLTRSGYRVDTAADGEAGLKAANDDPAGYDLIITDNNMPKLSGVELIKKLRSAKTLVPIILASGTLPSTTEHLHLNAVLAKPFFAQQLVETVKRVLMAAHGAC